MATKRRTREQWQQLIQDWQASGMSIASFCSRQDLTESNFYYWRKILQPESEPTQTEAPTWIAISDESDNDIQQTWQMELSLPGGAVLRIGRT